MQKEYEQIDYRKTEMVDRVGRKQITGCGCLSLLGIILIWFYLKVGVALFGLALLYGLWGILKKKSYLKSLDKELKEKYGEGSPVKKLYKRIFKKGESMKKIENDPLFAGCRLSVKGLADKLVNKLDKATFEEVTLLSLEWVAKNEQKRPEMSHHNNKEIAKMMYRDMDSEARKKFLISCLEYWLAKEHYKELKGWSKGFDLNEREDWKESYTTGLVE